MSDKFKMVTGFVSSAVGILLSPEYVAECCVGTNKNSGALSSLAVSLSHIS
jgi:hypothetical protein